jgi:hypothetical protein
MTLHECNRNNLCVDCDDERCWRRGDKGADCPKYTCDNPNGMMECENCCFIDEFILEMRKAYAIAERDRQ